MRELIIEQLAWPLRVQEAQVWFLIQVNHCERFFMASPVPPYKWVLWYLKISMIISFHAHSNPFTFILPFSVSRLMQPKNFDCTIVWTVTGFLWGWPKFNSRSRHATFVVGKVSLGLFSQYFGFLANSHSTKCSTFINHCYQHCVVSVLISSLNDELRKVVIGVMEWSLFEEDKKKKENTIMFCNKKEIISEGNVRKRQCIPLLFIIMSVLCVSPAMIFDHLGPCSSDED